MKKSLIIALLLLTFLPVALTGWMSWQLLGNAQANYEKELNQLVTQNFSAVEQRFLDHFKSIEQRLLASSNQLSEDPNTLRQLVWTSGILQQVAALDSEGKLIFPVAGSATDEENTFIARTQHLWQKGEFLSRIAQLEATVEKSSPPPRRALIYSQDAAPVSTSASESAQPMSADSASRAARRGWISWHWQNGLRHIWWLENANGFLIFELNAARLKADLINLLPDGDTPESARIHLRDSQGQLLYQWGTFEPKADATPTASFNLNAPLASWRLDWFSAGVTESAGAQWQIMAAYTGLLFLLLSGLSFYLYREHNRELKISRQRVSFVNQVSHELKTPLTNVRLYAELAADSLDEDEEPAQSHLRVISDESARLGRLINNVLSFARHQRGKLNLHLAQGVPDEVIGRTIDILEPSLKVRGIAVTRRLRANARASFDTDALEQVLINLVSNVEKYASEGKRVDVEARLDGAVLALIVRDYGPGVTKTHSAEIFDEFYRVSDAVDEGASGTGIGLSIARELCRLHGGDLIFEAVKPGSRFVATFLVERPAL